MGELIGKSAYTGHDRRSGGAGSGSAVEQHFGPYETWQSRVLASADKLSDVVALPTTVQLQEGDKASFGAATISNIQGHLVLEMSGVDGEPITNTFDTNEIMLAAGNAPTDAKVIFQLPEQIAANAQNP